MITTTSGESAPAAITPLPVALDTKGRVRVTKEQWRTSLAEFARSRESAPRFAHRLGLKYSTFAAWVQRYGRPKLPARQSPVRLLEAVVVPPTHLALQVQLPGGGVRSRAGQAMLSFSGSLKVFVAIEPCDMRNNSVCPIIPITIFKTLMYRAIQSCV